jgi:hypothetical protein
MYITRKKERVFQLHDLSHELGTRRKAANPLTLLVDGFQQLDGCFRGFIIVHVISFILEK